MIERNDKHNGKHTILYVEDDPAAVMLFGIALGELHLRDRIHLHTADDAMQALSALHQNQPPGGEWPDLLILDIHLPMRDGLSLLREIRETKLIPNIPVIFFTASRNSRDETQARQLGALAFIHKALDIENFVSSVKTACSYLPAH